MSTTDQDVSFDTRLSFAAARWLSGQPEGNLRIARDIIRRRAELRDLPHGDETRDRRAHDNGVIDGLLRALAMCSDRPGDISSTGAGGFIREVESADERVAAWRGPWLVRIAGESSMNSARTPAEVVNLVDVLTSTGHGAEILEQADGVVSVTATYEPKSAAGTAGTEGER